MIRITASMLALTFMSQASWAIEKTKPEKPLNTITLGIEIAKKLPKNSHPRVHGVCFWLKPGMPPKVKPGPALSQFLPDMVVTVSNNPGENPWVEAGALFENKEMQKGYQHLYQYRTGFPLGFGNDSMLVSPAHLNEGRSRVVHVYAAPTHYLRFPGISHQQATSLSQGVYYSSLADAVSERSEATELLYLATRPSLLIGHEIGTTSSNWGFEVPRTMHVTQPYRYRASVVAALHAADIASNEGFHIKQELPLSCGPRCAIANVVYDPSQQNTIWQEVYPTNRNILPGNKDDFGIDDDKKGNGNYVFVVWRKYQGCVRQEGRLISGPHVETTKKR